MAAPEFPHFRWPFGRDAAGGVSVVEQESADHLQGQQYAVVVTPVGWRNERPEFGWSWPEFAPMPLDLTGLENALHQFVPAADIDITQWADFATATVKLGVVMTPETEDVED